MSSVLGRAVRGWVDVAGATLAGGVQELLLILYAAGWGLLIVVAVAVALLCRWRQSAHGRDRGR